jgi:hypothetical protein
LLIVRAPRLQVDLNVAKTCEYQFESFFIAIFAFERIHCSFVNFKNEILRGQLPDRQHRVCGLGVKHIEAYFLFAIHSQRRY